MNGVITELKTDVTNLKQAGGKMKLKVVQNSTELEKRVNELEEEMVAVKDDIDTLQDADNTQKHLVSYTRGRPT